MIPIKKGLNQDASSLLLYNFALEYPTRKFQVRQGLKLHGTHQLLVHGGDVSILDGYIKTIKKNIEVFMVVGKVNGLEVNTEKCKYVVMFSEQDAGQNYKTKINKNALDSGTVQIFGNNQNKSNFSQCRT
jgi:hypothetical protein